MIARTAKKVGAHAVGSLDRAVGAWALRIADQGRAGTLDPEAREAALRMILPSYERASELPRAELFPAPGHPAVRIRRRGRRFGRPSADLVWPSEYTPLEAGTRDRYLACRRNQRAHARIFADPDRPRPTVVLLHGYLGGPHPVEERLWPIRWLLAHGLDVALCVLPHHGPRRPRSPGRPAFPDNDPRLTIEGFRQAVHDVRGLIAWLAARGTVIAARHDRICPPTHAERLAEHWQVPLTIFYGSHIAQLGRRRGFLEVVAMLRKLEWISDAG